MTAHGIKVKAMFGFFDEILHTTILAIVIYIYRILIKKLKRTKFMIIL
jgi:hypothetical protein